MTIQGLINKLEKTKKKIGPRARVTIDLRELKINKFPDYYTHWEINCLDTETMPWAIDDSFELKNGKTRYRTVVILS